MGNIHHPECIYTHNRYSKSKSIKTTIPNITTKPIPIPIIPYKVFTLTELEYRILQLILETNSTTLGLCMGLNHTYTKIYAHIRKLRFRQLIRTITQHRQQIWQLTDLGHSSLIDRCIT